jgi:long-chain fatty acid transport protein
MRRFHVWLAVGGLVALAGTPAPATAQGFSVNEHGTCAMGRAGTGVASPCNDGSSMFMNPAGLTQLKAGQTQISVGATFIRPSGGFEADTGGTSDLEDHTFPVPALYLSHGFSEKFAAGLGVFAPYGLTTDWVKKDNGVLFPGRFSAYKSHIANIYIQPTVAYKIVEKMSIGAGFDFNMAKLELKQRLDLSEVEVQPGVTFGNLGIAYGTDFADGTVKGDATSMGFHFGTTVEVTDRIAIGFRFLSRQTIDVDDGEATFNQVYTGITLPPGNPLGAPAGTPLDTILAAEFTSGGTLSKQKGTTSLQLPEQYSLGAAFKATDQLSLLFDWTMTNWEVWDEIVLKFANAGTSRLPQNYEKTHAFRFGAEYGLGNGRVIRGGYINHNGAAPDETVTPTLPEGDRSEFTVGFGTGIGSGGHLDLAYQYIDQADRRGRTRAYPAANDGVYAFSAHLFGATFTWNF